MANILSVNSVISSEGAVVVGPICAEIVEKLEPEPVAVEVVAPVSFEELRPVSELKKSNKNAWGGNRVESGRFISDGRMILVAESIYHPMKRDNMRSPICSLDELVEQSRIADMWGGIVANANLKAEVLGYKDGKVYLRAGELVVLLDVAQYTLIWNALKATEIRVAGPDTPVVLYKKNSPVGCLCPLVEA